MGVANKTELLLALLLAGDGEGLEGAPVSGITRLEKLVFLLEHDAGLLKAEPEREAFTFIPFRMGPWSQEVYDEVDFLESLGLIETKARGKRSASDLAHDEELFSSTLLDKYQKSSLAAEEGQEIFNLTKAGKEKALEIWRRLSEDQRREVMRIKSTFNHMNLRQLLRYVYKKFPEYATESEIRSSLGFS